MMKLKIVNGGCCGRFTCRNVNKKVCHPSKIIMEERFFGIFECVECNHYKPKIKKNEKESI